MGDEAAEWAQAEEASELLAGWRKEVRAFVRSKRPDQRISGKHWRALPSDQVWTREEVIALLPTDAPIVVGRESGQGRWRAEYKGVDHRSFSWKMRGGETNAVQELCQQCWQWHQQETLTLGTGDHCPVKGLWSS